MEAVAQRSITPDTVHAVLRQHMLADGMDMVLDMSASHGAHLVDEGSGRSMLDFFGFYASSALGMNHPRMLEDADFIERLTEAALNKVTNSDIYTTHMARFVQTMARVAKPDYFPYMFFVSGGALAIENALKTAFDWKVRKNFANGYRREVGHKVLHLDQAFHGRSGYTMSLTNTADPRKTQYFPKFDWPRIENPKIHFPLTDEKREDLVRREERALRQARRAFHEHGDDIACFIMEPIQGEGGDNHFRPSFLRRLRDVVHENDALLVFDEVQSGVGITGEMWAHQALGVTPDIMAFGKKTQVCGIFAGEKLDEVDGHVFETSSRINSTWGGNLVDMVRFDKTLEVIEEENLVAHAGTVGAHLVKRIEELADAHEHVTNPRGRGLMCAFDLPCPGFRDKVRRVGMERGVLVLGCGSRSIRFRSPLTITKDEVDEGMALVSEVVGEVAAGGPPKGHPGQ
ncbi:MAG: L-lysine 6-transaminase [Bacteroidetes bacterium]|nr:L-lysine 6-transaminase [Bacteroidota bacterium]